MGKVVGFFSLVCGILLVQCLADVHEGHGHSHGHGADKYKREFNEPHAHSEHEYDLHDHHHEHPDPDHHGHGHSHGHHGHQHLAQGASKYFREHNEPIEEEVHHEHEQEQEESGHDHDHKHVHEPAKDQTHGHHGHTHDHHGHTHGHHGHTHDHHGHTHQQKPEDLTYSVKHEHVGHDHDHVQEKPSTRTTSRRVRSTLTMWLEAIGSTLLISAAPFFILFFIPLNSNSAEQQPMLKVLLSFASGGLLGDAFLHLIPHAISPHTHDGDDHSHSHSHSHSHKPHDHSADMVVGLWVLAGMIAFLVVEKFVRIVKGGHGHGHSHGAPVQAAKNGDVVTSDKKDDKESDKKLGKRKKTDEASDDKDEVADDKEEEIQSQTSEDKHATQEEDIKVAGYLNLAADFTHNFTDGLAIGASFLVGRGLGIVTTITILLHEVPHEIGDFAILIQSGCTKRKAMCLQLLTAIGALAGCACGLLAEGIGSSATVWVLPFTAGGFIYIATVSVIPELLEDTKLGQSIKEIIGLLVGVFMMVLIAKIE